MEGEAGTSVTQEVHPRLIASSCSTLVHMEHKSSPSLFLSLFGFVEVLSCSRLLLGTVHRALFGDLFFRTASSGERVLVLEIIEPLSYALRSETRLRVVVPALDKRLANLLDALKCAAKTVNTF